MSVETTVKLADGTEQFQRRWQPEQARGAMLLAHGMGEHSEPYEHVGAFFAEAGFDVLAYDHRGYGRTGGTRGHIESFDVFVDDLGDLLDQRRQLGLPVVLFGHSLGGLMSILHLVKDRSASGNRPPDLAVLSAPALLAAVPLWQRLVAPVGSVVAPTYFKTSPPDYSILTRDERVQEFYASDDLRVGGVTLRLGQEIIRAIGEANRKLERIDVPAYVLHGEEDQVMPAKATAPLEKLANVTYRLWAGLRHEPHQEPEWESVLAEIVAWLDSQMAIMSNRENA